ncbi:MAG: hypothetical protein HY000_03935 [Planctomycetes bacterium]|nr:hypothetical protein [Planctomycetota bacterium]
MATASPVDRTLQSALRSCVAVLRRMAGYEMEPWIDRRVRRLGERKEFLNKEEHDELVALVELTQRRSAEKLEAKLALKRLSDLLPDFADDA